MAIIFSRLAIGLYLAMCVTACVQAADSRTITVVELFTSQGCSSCPPADAFLGELAKRDDVIALSQHVNYWDYLGWKDPFASASTTRRQREYAKWLGLRFVYTPQMILDGKREFVGTNRQDVLAYLASKHDGSPLNLRMDKNERGELVARIGKFPRRHQSELWLAVFDRTHVTHVKKGENRGRQLVNFNVVRQLEMIDRWAGERMEIPISNPACHLPSNGCAILLQDEENGHILAAVKLSDDSSEISP